jgi:hypothetical protein
MARYAEIYRESIDNGKAFWLRQAASLHWCH